MQISELKNLLVFMNRVTVQGQEAIAWVQCVDAIQREIAITETPTTQAHD